MRAATKVRLLYAYVGTITPAFNFDPNDFGFGVTEDSTPFLRSLALDIAGADQTARAMIESLDITLQLEGRDAASIWIRDNTDTYRPSMGASVEIRNLGIQLFKGQIVDFSEYYRQSEGRRLRNIELSLAGAGYAADRRVLWSDVPGASLFSVIIQTLQPQGIHQDIYGAYDFQPLPAPTIASQRVAGSTVTQFLQRAVGDAGDGWTFWWTWQDLKPLLHVRNLLTNPVDAPWDISDSSTADVIEIDSVDRDDSEYANRVFVRTEFQMSAVKVEQQIGNGAQDTWPLEFPPLEMILITEDQVSKTFGTLSGDRDTEGNETLDYYYQPLNTGTYWSQQVQHGAGTASNPKTPVANGAVIEFTYRADTGNKAFAEDTAEQAARAALLGFGSGIYDKVIEVKDIASPEAAQEYAAAMLARLKQQPVVARYRTHRHGLRPGQVQTIVNSKHGLNGEFIISSVRMRDLPLPQSAAIGIEYSIEATSTGKAVPHAARLWEDILDALRGGTAPGSGSGTTPGTGGGLGTGSIVWERPRGLVNGTNTTFYSTYIPQELETENRSIIAIKAGLTMYPFDDMDYTVTVDEGKLVYASGNQPDTGDDHSIIYLKKGGQSIGNKNINARKFEGGTDVIDWSANAAYYIQGGLSIGVWLKLNSSSADNQTIITRGVGDGSITQYALMVSDQSGEWGIRYFHDDASNNPQTIEYDLDLAEDIWYYIGISRNSVLGTALLHLGDGEEIIRVVYGSYVIPPGGADTGTRNLGVGKGFGGFGGSTLQGTIQEHYISSRSTPWSKAEHKLAMQGSPPASGLVLSVRLLGNSPEQDESSTGASGTVTGTQIVPGRI